MILLENGCFYHPNIAGISAMLIDKGKIVAISRNSTDLKQYPNINQHIDLRGKVVWPGLTDAHIHLTSYGLNMVLVDCETNSLKDCLNRVDIAAQNAPGGTWVLGHGWNQNRWQAGYGTAVQLDAVSHTHPIYLTAKSLHAGWANSLALQIAGISINTQAPPGGSIARDESGTPTGILFESATRLITPFIPKRTKAEISSAILEGMNSLNRMGITTVHDFDPLDRLEYYQQLEQDNRLHLRILKVIPPDDHKDAIEAGYHTGHGGALVHIGPYKYFMDGALGPRTAAMIEPYNDDPTNFGVLNLTAEEIIDRSTEILAHGSDISIHAIGDLANLEAIKAFRSIRVIEKTSGKKPVKLRIEHVQLLKKENLADFNNIGIYASMQPLHATSDMEMADKYWGGRTKYAYAWKSLLNQGTSLVFGSDAPVDSPNPFWGIHSAVTRQHRDDSPAPDGWIPSERLSLKEALDAYSTGPAGLYRTTSNSGKLEPGANADLIVLTTDPFREKAQVLHQIKPVATMFNGQWAWVDQGVDV